MNNGVRSAIGHGVTDLIIVGDSRLSQVTKVVLSESRKTELKALNNIPEVLYVDEQALAETDLPAQRMQSIPQTETHAVSQIAEEPQVTAVTRNQSRRVRFAESTRHRPTGQEAVNDVDDLPADQESPISPQGGAQRSTREGTGNLETTLDEPTRADPKEASESEDPTTVQTERIRRVGLYTTVIRRVLACADCSTSKGNPQIKRYSPSNVLAEQFFQLLSMDFVTPLPKTRRGKISPLLFQCSFTGYVIAKAMSSTNAQDVAEVFEEYVFRRFGAPTMIRYDPDPRFMTETFNAFAELIQARLSATLSYRPQANGQQERSVKSIVQTVNVYVEDPLQRDWDDIAEKIAHAINNAMDTTRKQTPFYLVHGWDAQSTLKAMTSSLRLGNGSLTDAAAWRREANRQHDVALALAKQYQAIEKARRTKEHNEALGRLERMAVPVDERSDPTEVGDPTSDPTYRPLFEPGSRLELPDKAGYRFFPVVHVSRLKPVREDNCGPTAELVDGLGEDDRFDFDEELLPKDGWKPEAGDDAYVVEAILDDRVTIAAGTERNQREFYVKWRGYDDPIWEPVSNLSCGGLLFVYRIQSKRENRFQMVQVAVES
ncbi:unnamed protein product [Phytophthora fragariaefolia]|uniref:Unnamed protein product n=1 Tax=Phytophthora fragariaefolia TaxID=1490495 RepID=A0A9W6U6Z5_9STRA|nr:unnamed protein product [Phytophthora fragariaefolia]